jgi:hypothetical protein
MTTETEKSVFPMTCVANVQCDLGHRVPSTQTLDGCEQPDPLAPLGKAHFGLRTEKPGIRASGLADNGRKHHWYDLLNDCRAACLP